MSKDGHYQTATVASGYVYISSDYGKTWSSKITESAHNWSSVCMSASGQYQAVSDMGSIDKGGDIYLSYDYGSSWETIGGSRHWSSVAMSDKVECITALDKNGYIYILYDN